MEEHLHSDVFVGNHAADWIRHHVEEAPLFLQIGFPGPHEPYDRHLTRYEEKILPAPVFRDCELDSKPPQHRAHQENFASVHDGESSIRLKDASMDDLLHMQRHYYAKITTVDEKIGDILHALEEKGYMGNSVILLLSDHGDNLGDHRLPYKWLMYDPSYACH